MGGNTRRWGWLHKYQQAGRKITMRIMIKAPKMKMRRLAEHGLAITLQLVQVEQIKPHLHLNTISHLSQDIAQTHLLEK